MRSKTESYLHLAAAFRVEYSDGTVAFALEAMDDVTDEEMAEVCKEVLKRCRFMPTISELRDFVEAHRERHPPAAVSRKATPEDELRYARRQDRCDMGLTEEEYEEYVKQQEKETGQPYYPLGYQPEVNNAANAV